MCGMHVIYTYSIHGITLSMQHVYMYTHILIMDTHRYLPIIIYIIIIFFIYNIYIYVLLYTATHISCITSILLSQCTCTIVCIFSCMFSLLKDEGVATKVNVCMSTCICICTMLYSIVLHFFTYLNKMFVAFDQWGSNNQGFTVYIPIMDPHRHLPTYIYMYYCTQLLIYLV